MAEQGDTVINQVQEIVRQEQSRVERVVSWLQLGVIALLGVLYWFSPRATQTSSFEPVLIVLALYLPLLVLRLVLSYRGSLCGGRLIAFLVTDVAMTGMLIWSYHLQYHQPPSFSLKATTFSYFFIYLALASLRYEVKYIAWVGGSAVLCWLGILAHSLFDPSVERTSLYVEYVMTNKVLLGAEIDKMLVLFVVTIILSVAVFRAKSILFNASLHSKVRQQMQRFFSKEVSQKISSRGDLRPGHGETHEMVTIVMDIRGSSKLATQLPPDELLALLAEYQERMVKPVFEQGGTIDKFMGDGILIHFGVNSEDDACYAAKAFRAMDHMIEAARHWNEERKQKGLFSIHFGIGCAWGPSVFGIVGNENRMEFTVIGNSVNLAAKLESHTKVEKALAVCTAEAFELAVKQGYEPKRDVPILRQRSVSGMPKPIDVAIFCPLPDKDVSRAA